MFTNPPFSPTLAYELAQMNGYCGVAAIVMAFQWPPGVYVEWHYRKEINDWSAKLHTSDPNLKKFWMNLCQQLALIPDAGANNRQTAMATVLEFTDRSYTPMVLGPY